MSDPKAQPPTVDGSPSTIGRRARGRRAAAPDERSSEAAVTRDRLLDASAEEFATHGFAGARIDRIAERAGRNKQLIYHHFGNKAALYEAVIMRVLAQHPPVKADTPEHLQHALHTLFDDFAERESWWRLMLWEALESGSGPLVAEEERRAATLEKVAEVERAQQAGFLDPKLPPRLLVIAISGMILVPFLMPQLVRLWIGTHPRDPAFHRAYREVVGEILSRLGPRPPG